MKRVSSVCIIMLLMINAMVFPAAATDKTVGDIIYYEDGSYALVTFCEDNLARSNTEKSKSYIYFNPFGQKCFSYTLYAVFTYDGITSRAISHDFGAAIYQQGWDIDSHSEYVSGNTAYGRATFTGPDGQTRTVSLTLTCDKNGNVT